MAGRSHAETRRSLQVNVCVTLFVCLCTVDVYTRVRMYVYDYTLAIHIRTMAFVCLLVM